MQTNIMNDLVIREVYLLFSRQLIALIKIFTIHKHQLGTAAKLKRNIVNNLVVTECRSKVCSSHRLISQTLNYIYDYINSKLQQKHSSQLSSQLHILRWLHSFYMMCYNRIFNMILACSKCFPIPPDSLPSS